MTAEPQWGSTSAVVKVVNTCKTNQVWRVVFDLNVIFYIFILFKWLFLPDPDKSKKKKKNKIVKFLLSLCQRSFA